MPLTRIVLPKVPLGIIIPVIEGDDPMLDFHLLSIIGIGLLGGLIALRMARNVYRCRHAMDLHAQKVMGFDQSRADHAHTDQGV